MYFPGGYFPVHYFTHAYFGPGAALSDPCGTFEYDPFGRKGIGVVQPISGTDYPLVRPSEDVRYLLADFYLYYEDPADYDAALAPFRPPFRLAWLYGFGCMLEPIDYFGEGYFPTRYFPRGYFGIAPREASLSLPFPDHAADVIVVDADDRVVFDSTDADTFATREWGTRLRVFCWESSSVVCRAVVHTAWSVDETPTPRHYPLLFTPEDATLDARVTNRAPKRVRSIRVLTTTVSAGRELLLAGGYNMTLAPLAPRVRGRRHTVGIEFRVVPGSGDGRYLDCAPPPVYVRTINGVGPNAAGYFFFSATDCYFARQPTIKTGDDVIAAVLQSPYDAIAEGMPDDLAGISKFAAGWPTDDDPFYAHLQLGNDCQPCCDCPDYIAMAVDLNTLRDAYAVSADRISRAAVEYREVNAAWDATRDCALSRPITIVLQPQFSPFLDIAVQFSNNTTTCLWNVTLLLEFDSDQTGAFIPWYTFLTDANGETGRFVFAGAWPNYSASWAAVPAGGTVVARGRLQFPDGTVPTVSLTVTGTSILGPLTIPGGDPATATETVVLNPPVTQAETYGPPPSTSD